MGTDQACRYKNQLTALVNCTDIKRLPTTACSSQLSRTTMVQSDNVEVYITRHKDDRRFKEYRVPITSDKYRADPNEVYIEAVTNERFEVNVRLLRGFDWKGFPNVRITYDIDRTSYVGFLYKNSSNVAREDRRRDQLGEVDQTIGGRTVVCGLAFGELEIGMLPNCWSSSVGSDSLSQIMELP